MCCTDNFGSSGTCVADSKATTVVASKPSYFYPDQHNKGTCVFSSFYEDWMNAEGYSDYYLFSDGAACCNLWFPDSTSCPDTNGATPYDVNDGPSPLNNFFYPDDKLNNCGYGRDYPVWMGDEGYAPHYLFSTPAGCCDKYYPGRTDCPAETTPQTGYFWESYAQKLPIDVPDPPQEPETVFYPDQASKTCINGYDYPSWMAAEGYSRLYIFDTAEGCCNYWYGDSGSAECLAGLVIRPTSPAGTGATTTVARDWYPQLSLQACSNDGNIPDWMLGAGFSTSFTFVSERECCNAWGYDCPGATTTTTTVPFPTGGSGLWYPKISEKVCSDDSYIPAWMQTAEYSAYYTFGSEAACCAAFDCGGL
jgi:insulin receptor substrate 1